MHYGENFSEASQLSSPTLAEVASPLMRSGPAVAAVAAVGVVTPSVDPARVGGRCHRHRPPAGWRVPPPRPRCAWEFWP